MTGAFVERLARVPGVPEDSVSIRLVVAAMVEVAVLAVVAQGAVDAASAAGALVLVPAGYAFSSARRRRPSIATKLVLAAGLVVVLGAFLKAVEGAQSFDEARQPLASLFLWVQVLHSFDVPRRRDLGFSAISSLILIAEAGALSFGTGFLVFLLPWLALAAAYLLLTLDPGPGATPSVVEIRRPPDRRGRGRPVAIARTIATWAGAAAIATSVAFLALPRLPGLNVALPPFRADRATAVEGFDGRVVNPGLTVGPDGIPDFTDLAYPGFGSSVDLRARGRLSDEIVMRVRSPQAALWRGMAYDTFDGTTWTAGDERVVPVTKGVEESFDLFAPGGVAASTVGSRRVLATFYVEADLPNVVFGAYRPVQVYFPASNLMVDPNGSIRAPILLEPGVVYSVVSDLPGADPEALRGLEAVLGTPGPDTSAEAALLAPYLQLPRDLPARVIDLAERITAGAPTRVDAVQAVESWLRRNTEYDLDVPADPPGANAIDRFLFETRRGFCEHIASAMAVLLRASGIPTRFVTGFGPGDRNPFTGYWEVRASDAHAWVEVLYPGAGWVPYDPTFGVPPAEPSLAERLVAPEVLAAVGRFFATAIPEPVRDAVRVLGRTVVSVADAWPLVVVVLAVGTGAGLLLRRRGARRRRGPPATGAAKAFAELEEAMTERGHPRSEHQTAAEFLHAVRPYLAPDGRADAELIVRLFERDRFSGIPATDHEVAAALDAAGRIGEADQGSRKRISVASATRS